MCFENPQPPSAAQTLNSDLKAAPQLLSADEQYAPEYQQLGLQNLSSYLTGSAGNTSGGIAGMLSNNLIPQLTNADIASNTATRTATVADATNLAPAVNASIRASDPNGAGMLDQLDSATANQLSYGTQLTPAEQLQMNQSVRSGSAARGLGYGPSDVFNESLADTNEGQNLLTQREGAASGAVSQNQSFWGDSLSRLTGITGTAGGQAGSLLSAGQAGAQPAMVSQFDPNSPANLQEQNEQFQSNEAGAENDNHWIGAVDTLGSNASSY